METVDARQHRSVHRCNFQPPPDCVGMDVEWESDRLRQVGPTCGQDQPCELLLRPPSRNIALVFKQLVGVAEGLTYLHQRDVVHGDLKGVGSPSLPNFGRSSTPTAERHGGRRQPPTYNRFRPRFESRPRRAKKFDNRRHCKVDCA